MSRRRHGKAVPPHCTDWRGKTYVPIYQGGVVCVMLTCNARFDNGCSAPVRVNLVGKP